MPSKAVCGIVEHFVPSEGLGQADWVALIEPFAHKLTHLKKLRLSTLGEFRCLRQFSDRDTPKGQIGFEAVVFDPVETGLTLKSHGIFGCIDSTEYGGFNRQGKGVRHLWAVTDKGWFHLVVHYYRVVETSFFRNENAVASAIDVRPMSLDELLSLKLTWRIGSRKFKNPYRILRITPNLLMSTLEEQRVALNKRVEEFATEMAPVNQDSVVIRAIFQTKNPVLRRYR
jgi:hypothetical protein